MKTLKGLCVLFALWVLTMLFCAGAFAAGEDLRHGYGYTKQQTTVYSAVSPKVEKKGVLPSYTVVRIVDLGGKYLTLADGTFVRADDVGIFTILGAKGVTVYWQENQTMYATGNPNHPLQATLPANTAVEPLGVMIDYYLVRWDGVYGFAPRKTAKEPPAAKPVAPVYALLGPEDQLFDLPLLNCQSSFRLPGETGMIIGKMAEAYYAVEWNGRLYYLPKENLKNACPAEESKQQEGYADQDIPLLDVPDAERGRVIGTVKKDSVCAMRYSMNGFVQVESGNITGFADENAFTYAGGNGRDRYYIFLNKATRELTVYKADDQGLSTGEEVLRVVVAIGKVTTPTPSGIFTIGPRERWHAFSKSYSPYAMRYTADRFIHGPLYLKESETTVVRSRLGDFGHMATGGCLRTPYEQVRWIYYHCPDGTTLEIVGGVQQPQE